MIKDHLLLRYLEEQSFVDMFMDGHIRLNSLDFFLGEHDEPTKDGQIDVWEGLTCPIDAQSIEDCKPLKGYRYCNLLCCNRLNYFQNEIGIVWSMNMEMANFGDYVVIIKDPDEFQRRLVSAAEERQYKCLCRGVDYSEKYDRSRDVFDKSTRYAYQNEWRAALYRGVTKCEPCELNIGPVDDISEWCYTRELEEHIIRIFSDKDFVSTHDDSLGNVTRSEFSELFLQI